jgi:ABC-type glycerol-3-phosphate transport system permease component
MATSELAGTPEAVARPARRLRLGPSARVLPWGAYLVTRAAVYGMALAVLVPMLYLVSVSFQDSAGSREAYLLFIPKEPTLENYTRALQYAADVLRIPVWRMYMNSGIYTVASIVLSLALSATAAFGFANYDFPAKEALFVAILATMMIPGQALLIPLFLMLKQFSLLDTYFALILPYTALGVPFTTLLLRGFFEALPKELRDAARIDGSSDFGYFWRVVLPLSIPALATVIIFLFLFYWNEFLLALVMIQDEALQPLTLGLSRITAARATAPVSTYAAVILLTVFPILLVFMIFQRWFVRGIAAGAIKG